MPRWPMSVLYECASSGVRSGGQQAVRARLFLVSAIFGIVVVLMALAVLDGTHVLPFSVHSKKNHDTNLTSGSSERYLVSRGEASCVR